MRRLIRRGGHAGGGSRPDDWSSPHDRARALAAERLESPLDAADATWLDDHIASCADCAAVGDDYARQRLGLRALRDYPPVPPRDLWARTATAIEREAGFRARAPRHRSRQALIAPYALLSGALAVALVVGTLTSSQLPGNTATAAPGSPAGPLAVSIAPDPPLATPMIVGPGSVAWLSRENGGYHINTATVDRVCPHQGAACAETEPSQTRELRLTSDPSTVFGSPDGRRLITLGTDDGGAATVYVVPVDEPGGPPATPPPAATPSPIGTITAPPTGSDSPSPTTEIPPPTPPVATATPSLPAESASPVSPSPFASGALEIARGVRIVETTAAYSPDGTAFAFTAYPVDGSQGPDIYLWRVGDPAARAMTSDHRSVFGSWSADQIVGSSVESDDDERGEPAAFLLDPMRGDITPLLQTGRVWRPAVDPTGTSAVYWAGRLERTADGLGWATTEGRLVIGRWTAADAVASDAPEPTKLTDDQAAERRETRITRGPLTDWEARWDETGERLAVWVADRDDPTVGRLSLYVVDPFDGRIDLDHPPLSDEPALAGFSISDGRLAWAAPPDEDSKANRVLILAWSETGFGKVESAPGDMIVVR